ncbi:hypothetical protein RclHR1_18650004 [Rhizophagus clarus]|nr:hypothetical protein RclHR1_18650004 [Rhizophagus clarus]
MKREFATMIQAKTKVNILEKLEADKNALRDLWPRQSSWNIQTNQPRQIPIGSQYPEPLPLELAIYWDVCPFLLDYVIQACEFASRQAAEVCFEMGILPDAKKGKKKAIETPIKNSDDNTLMDIEISQPEVNQSTPSTMLITTELKDDKSFQPVLSKSQKKKHRKKEKAEREALKANKKSASSLDPSAKQFIPSTKVVENEASTVITGYLPDPNSQVFVRDIIVYDISAKWDNITIINALSDWGKVISMTVKRQKKYKTLCVKFEMAQLFRNYEKHWMAPLLGIPV